MECQTARAVSFSQEIECFIKEKLNARISQLVPDLDDIEQNAQAEYNKFCAQNPSAQVPLQRGLGTLRLVAILRELLN